MLTGRWSVAVLISALAIPVPRPAQVLATTMAWTPNGIPASPADGAQIKPRIVPDGSGGAIIAWEDKRVGPYLAYAQHLTAEGTTAPGWPADGVALPNRGISQSNLVMVPDGAGGAFVASDDNGYAGVVIVHHLGIDGSPATGWPTSAVTLQAADFGEAGGTQGAFLPALLADDAGGVFVARTYRDRLHQSITLTRLSSSAGFDPAWGSGLFAGAGWDFPSGLCSDGQGGVFVAFQADGIPPRIWTERFDGLGKRVFSGKAVSPAPLDQTALGLVSDGGIGAIVVWEDHRNGAFDQLFAQRILADGSTSPGWPADGLRVCAYPTAPGSPSYFVWPGPLSSVVPDGAGGAFVAWTDYRGGAESDIYAQHILGNATFAPGWPVDGLAVCAAPNTQERPSVASDGAGGVLVAWQDGRSGADEDIYAQHLIGNGAIASGWAANGFPICTAPGDQVTPIVAADASGNAFIAWSDARAGTPNIYATRVGAGQIPPAVEAPAATFARPVIYPNPSFGRGFTTRFTLPSAESATLEVLDITGRRVAQREVGSLGVGSHSVELREAAALPAGVYQVRLAQGGRVGGARAIVMP